MLKIVGLLVGVALLSGACGDGGTSRTASPTPRQSSDILKITGFDVQRTPRVGSWYFVITVQTTGSCKSYSGEWTMPDGKVAIFDGGRVSFEVTISGKFDLPVTVIGCHVLDRDVVHLSTEPNQVY